MLLKSLQEENLRLKVRLRLSAVPDRATTVHNHLTPSSSPRLVQTEAERVAAMADAYTADKQAYARTIAALEEAKRAAETRLDKVREATAAAERSGDEARGEAERLQAQCVALERDNELHQDAITSLQQVSGFMPWCSAKLRSPRWVGSCVGRRASRVACRR